MIQHRVMISAPAEEVFFAIGTAAGLDGWWTRGARVDPAAGEIVFRWTEWGADRETGEDAGRLRVYEPPHELAFDWHAYGDDRVTRVHVRIREMDEGVMMEVEDAGHRLASREDAARFAKVAAGWAEALTLVKMFAEHGLTYDAKRRLNS